MSNPAWPEMFDPQQWDVVKLVAQFIGAVVITWLAVGWALRRFQREKAWERRFTAYLDALTAMSEMRLLVGMEIDEIESGRETSDELRRERAVRRASAKRELDQVVAVSDLLFPARVSRRIASLDDTIAAGTGAECGLYEVINIEYSILDDTIHDMRNDARHALGLESRWERWRRRIARKERS